MNTAQLLRKQLEEKRAIAEAAKRKTDLENAERIENARNLKINNAKKSIPDLTKMVLLHCDAFNTGSLEIDREQIWVTKNHLQNKVSVALTYCLEEVAFAFIGLGFIVMVEPLAVIGRKLVHDVYDENNYAPNATTTIYGPRITIEW